MEVPLVLFHADTIVDHLESPDGSVFDKNKMSGLAPCDPANPGSVSGTGGSQSVKGR